MEGLRKPCSATLLFHNRSSGDTALNTRTLSSLKARFVNTSRCLFFGSFPVISSPSLGHGFVPAVCRIQPSSPPGRLMRESRLHCLGSTCCRLAIRFPPTPHVERRLGQVAGDGANGFAMALAQPQPHAPIQLADMALGTALMIQRHAVARFDKGPL